MSVNPTPRARTVRVVAPPLSRQLIDALQRTPGFRRPSPPPAAPWATLWLVGTTAGIATPLALHAIGASRPPTPLAAGSATVASRNDRSRIDLRQTAPPRTVSSEGYRPAPLGPSAIDQALGAAFSALPSPFTRPPSAAPAPGEATAPGDQASPGARRQGAALLGDTLGLADRLAIASLPSGRPIQADPRLQADTSDPLASRWSEHLRALVRLTPLVLPVEVVRVRSDAVDRPRAIPMALWPDGSATTNVEPPPEAGQRLAEDWVRQQPALAEGSVRPVVMVIEPAAAEPAVTTTTTLRAEQAPPAPEPAWEAPSAAGAAAAPAPAILPAAPELPAAPGPGPMAAAPEPAAAPAP